MRGISAVGERGSRLENDEVDMVPEQLVTEEK